MAYEIPGFSFPLPAGADFSSGKQFRFVDLNTSGQVVNPAAGAGVVGVRQTTPKSGEAATIVHSGVSIVECGDTVTAGDLVATDNVGRAVTAATGNVTVGRALETGSAAGVQIAVLLIPAAAQA